MLGFDVHVGKVAAGVLVTLLAMSIVSIGIMIERSWTYRQATRQSRRYAGEAARLLRLGKLQDAAALAAGGDWRHSHLAPVLTTGLEEWLGRTDDASVDRETAVFAVKEAVQHATALRVAELRRGLSVLATIGSTAPFVGLFGTTFGIIDAFAGIALTGTGGIMVISTGISEALITTAFGLFVAVPAVWAYNYLLGRIEGMTVEMERSGYQLAAHLAKRGA